jgi:hypothetical protein
MMLPFNNEKNGNAAPGWAMALPGDQRTLEYEAVWKEAGRQIRAHLDQTSVGAKCVRSPSSTGSMNPITKRRTKRCCTTAGCCTQAWAATAQEVTDEELDRWVAIFLIEPCRTGIHPVKLPKD